VPPHECADVAWDAILPGSRRRCQPPTLVARRLHFGLLVDRDLDPLLGAMRAALEDAMNGRFAPPDRG
jgi:hypothetical protein